MKVAIIPARSNSKRIPHKNNSSFCGKPIIAWSIKVVHNCQVFDPVTVSTNCEHIAAISKTICMIPRHQAQNIDTEEDGLFAEYLFKASMS